MQTYSVTLDQLVHIWNRSTFIVDADTLEQALEIAKERCNTDNPDDFEYLMDYEQIIPLEENEGQATEEWRVDNVVMERNGL